MGRYSRRRMYAYAGSWIITSSWVRPRKEAWLKNYVCITRKIYWADMNIRRFGMSFKDAWKGLRFVFMHEQNFRIHCTIGVVVISTTIFLPLATADRAII